jgi:DNA invertase Pin-like site-specific DNA recombinase
MSETAYKAIAYVRVSTGEQRESGLEAQRTAVTVEAERRGWELVHVFEDAGASGKSMSGRPGLQEALGAVEGGEADVLLVSKLDRLSRSLVDFAGLMQRAQRKGWQLVALDVNIDTTTAAGALVANVMASVAEWERRTIGERTAAALAVKKANGVRLGRPREISEETIERVRELYEAGLTVAAIARRLNEEGVPTPRGGSWFSPGVKRALTVRT